MELFSNFVWALVASVSVICWPKLGRRTAAGRRGSLVALAMLIVILFPVISVSDDLWSIRNPAETDTCQRRAHRDGNSHTDFSITATLPEPIGTELGFEFQRLSISRQSHLPAIENPALGPIENRPPPVA